jgi:hypothetical protein
MYKHDHTLILGKKSDPANNPPVKCEFRFPPILKTGCSREVLFWLLLLPAFSSLASTRPRGRIAGIVLMAASGGAILAAPLGAKARIPDGGSGPPGGRRITRAPRSGREKQMVGGKMSWDAAWAGRRSLALRLSAEPRH